MCIPSVETYVVDLRPAVDVITGCIIKELTLNGGNMKCVAGDWVIVNNKCPF